VRTGRLRHRVRIERYTQTQDEYGAIVEAWAPLADVWAEVQALRGREYWEAQQVAAEAVYRLTIRYRDDLTTEDRIVHGDTMMDIQHAADPDGRRAVLEVLCKT
jgi:SPP1 family predicted phage head-tail adaptor